MLFNFLTAVDQITPCDVITNEEQDILQTHFLDLSAHVREKFEVYTMNNRCIFPTWHITHASEGEDNGVVSFIEEDCTIIALVRR